MTADRPSHYPPSRRVRLKEYLLFGLMPLVGTARRPRLLYELESTRNLLTRRSLYRNLGSWEHSTNLDEACEEMAALLGRAAGIGPGTTVLDAGFGFADQDIYWATELRPDRIVGVDIIPSHLQLAKRRIAERGLDDRIELRLRSATDTGLPDDSVDAVVALESALHFPTREAFFREAYRVLRPGGRLAVVEPIPMSGNTGRRSSGRVARVFGATPRQNLYSRDRYAAHLREAGFDDVKIRSIWPQVLPGFMSYLEQQLREPDVRARVNPVVRMMWLGWLWSWHRRPDPTAPGDQDYILAVGTAPCSGPTGPARDATGALA